MQAPVAAVAVAVAIPIEVATQVAAEVEVAVSAAHSAMKMPNSKRNNNNNNTNESISVLADWLLSHCDIDNRIPKRRTNLSKHTNQIDCQCQCCYTCIVYLKQVEPTPAIIWHSLGMALFWLTLWLGDKPNTLDAGHHSKSSAAI